MAGRRDSKKFSLNKTLKNKLKNKMTDEKLRARVCGDYELFDGEMLKAIKVLRDNGFMVTSTPASGVPVELYYGSDTYRGLKDITKFVNSVKDKYSKSSIK